MLAPHTDDGELGCGGTIAHFVAAGAKVSYAAFCLCAESLPSGLAADTLEKECREATAALGIPADQLFLFNYKVRHLPEQRQNILQELITLNNKIKPDLVFLPAATDIHQDHQVIYQEGQRAFKNTSFAGYELPWNNFSIRHNFFIRLTPDELEKKIRALKAYRSQSHRNYMDPEFIRSLAKVRGLQANAEYAEAFELYRLHC